MFVAVKTKINYNYNLAKVKNSKKKHFWYILMCPICFPFHMTVLFSIVIPSIFINFTHLSESVILCCTVPIICVLIDNLILFLARDAK